jgi:methyl-accepting chemotaxis protein
MNRGYKRRNFFIKKGFQARFIARFVAVSFVGGILAVASFNYLAYKKIDALLFSMKMPAVNAGNVLLREAVIANGLAFALIVIVYLLTAKGIRTKMVRPLRNIRADIHRLTRGDLGTRIQLGKDEEFTDLAEDLNLMAGELQRRFSDLKEKFERIDAPLRELGSGPEADGKILKEKILPQVAAFRERLSEFKR